MSRTVLSLSFAVALAGGEALADVPRVAVDIAPVHSLVSRVMEGVGAPALIVQSGASPHEYSLRPSEAAALQEADLVFWVSSDLTPWLAGAIDALASDASKTELLEANETIKLGFREGALFEAHQHGEPKSEEHAHDDHADHKGHDDHADHKGHDDHADHEGHDDHADHKGHDDHADHKGHDDHADHKGHGDHADHTGHEGHAGHDHGEHDPHAWLSPQNAAAWLNVIAGQLASADPENAGAYFANAAAARAEIDALTADVNAVLEPLRGTRFIVFHDAYQYFENAFDFPASGAISISDASDPSPARVAEIQQRVLNEGIDCVLAEPQFNAALVDAVLDGTEAKTGVLDPLGSDLEPGSGLYPLLIRNLALTFESCK